MSITVNQTVVRVLLSVNEDTQVVNVSITPMAVSIPTGGTEDQILAKNSNANYDFKWVTPTSGPGGGVTDHGALTGLADDDHTQYHNDERGDIRYSQLGHTHDADEITTGTKTSSFISDFILSVRNTILTGISFVTGTDITASDNVLSAFGKLQAKWTDLFDSGTGKIKTSHLPDSILGQVEYQGGWNAATNTPAIPAAATGNKGHYYVTSVAGSLFGLDFNTGDWIISNGTSWEKVDNTDAVATVFGRTGSITAQSGDYTADQVTETASREFISPTQKGYLPSSAEKDALAGSSGTPSLSNKYVTNADSRLSDARTPTTHTHDDRYYTETEMDIALSAKAATSHTHDDRYYTETEMDIALNLKQNIYAPVSSVLGADVTMTTAGTWYSGPAVTLGAGTWLIIAQVNISNPTGTARYNGRIHDGTVAVGSGGGTVPSVGDRETTIPLMALVSPSGSTTYTVQAVSSQNSSVLESATAYGGQPACTQIIAKRFS